MIPKNPLNNSDVDGNTMAWMGDCQGFRDYECMICGGTEVDEDSGKCVNCGIED